MPARLLAPIRRLDPGQTLGRILIYRATLLFLQIMLGLLYRARVEGRHHVPRDGKLLLVSNHQSFFDPPLVGMLMNWTRHSVPLARSGLFKNPVFGWFIKALNAISLKQDEADAGAIRAAVREIQAERAVLIFPEGSRSWDGGLQPFQRGTWLLIKRAKCDVLPIAIEGAFDAWPRESSTPRLFGCRLAIEAGAPIPYEELASLDAETGLALLTDRVEQLRLNQRERLRRATSGRFPAPGPGDQPWTPGRPTGQPDETPPPPEAQ